MQAKDLELDAISNKMRKNEFEYQKIIKEVFSIFLNLYNNIYLNIVKK